MTNRGPRRTCAACRGEEDRDDLVRIVVSPDGRAVVDLRGKLPGRGVWLHPRRECVDELRAGVLARALDTPGLDGSDVPEQLRNAVQHALRDGLSLAARAGALVGGHDRLILALRDREIDLLVVASDASERSIADLKNLADPSVELIRVPFDKDSLGTQIGKGDRAAIGVRPSVASAVLRTQLRRWRALG